ncbi:S1 RNA-binding domain-containing protein [Cytobacillus firmus]|nr:S1 RNA-binding domain-containing protein [Cytobacillus firmus]
MEELTTKSWKSEEQLDDLARYKRNKEIVKGVVTSVGVIKARVLDADSQEYVNKETEIAYLMLENGVTAYCPAHEFSSHEFRSLNGFAGTMQEFLIDHLDLEQEILLVSIKKADEIKRAKFLSQLEVLEESDQLHEFVFDGTITGFDRRTRRIFVRVNGVDCTMYPDDYSWERGRRIEEQIHRGENIKVKIIRFNKERNTIRVSRRHTMEDPYEKLESLQSRNAIAGKVSGVDAVHGIFIQLDVGLEVKGVKPNYLEEPVVGDVVSCAIRSIDKENRRAKVVITGYPRGKKKRRDVGAFLFE